MPVTPNGRARIEIGLVLVAILLHVLLTQVLGIRGLDILPTSLLVLGYACWQGRAAAVRADWGTRRQNFAACMHDARLLFGGGAIAIAAVGGVRDTLVVDAHLLVTLLVYPVWGTAQQFLVLSLLAHNLDRRGWSRAAVTAVTAVLFAAVHYHRPVLMPATALLGIWCTQLFLRHRNLWPLGLAHGVLGALFYRWALGVDVVNTLLTAR